LSAAVREANEELRVCDTKTNCPCILSEKDLHQVGEVGQARWNGKGNVERSTIFLVPIRANWAIHPMDDIKGIFFPVKTERRQWQTIRKYFLRHDQYACKDREEAEKAGCLQNKSRWQFADGIARILENDNFFDMVYDAINELRPDDFGAM